MKKLIIFSIFLFSIFTAGCSKDAEVTAFIKELDAATKEIVTTVDSDPTSAGVDRAQRSFDARKPELTSKWNAIKDAVGIQVSGETKKKLEDSVKANMKALTDVSLRNMLKMTTDKEAGLKFQRLLTDYGKTFSATAG